MRCQIVCMEVWRRSSFSDQKNSSVYLNKLVAGTNKKKIRKKYERNCLEICQTFWLENYKKGDESMQQKQVHILFSIVLIVLLVTGFSQKSLVEAKSLSSKIRTCTGVITRVEDERLTLDLGKRGELVVCLSTETRIMREEKGALSAIEEGDILQVRGEGQENNVLAKQIILLPADEKFVLLKRKKQGFAYTEKIRSTKFKAKVIKTDPLTVVNRSHQEIVVALSEKGKITKQRLVDQEYLKPGIKIKMQYRKQNTENWAKKIIICMVMKKKQAKR